jgi:hypothetical protein
LEEKTQFDEKASVEVDQSSVLLGFVTSRFGILLIGLASFPSGDQKLIMVDTLSIKREIQNPNSGHIKQVAK